MVSCLTFSASLKFGIYTYLHSSASMCTAVGFFYWPSVWQWWAAIYTFSICHLYIDIYTYLHSSARKCVHGSGGLPFIFPFIHFPFAIYKFAQQCQYVCTAVEGSLYTSPCIHLPFAVYTLAFIHLHSSASTCARQWRVASSSVTSSLHSNALSSSGR